MSRMQPRSQGSLLTRVGENPGNEAATDGHFGQITVFENCSAS